MHFEINSDVGEQTGNDAAIMPYLDACSIACGGHAGDAHTMREAVLLAKKYNVRIGAHPSFPDRENFGRRVIVMEREELIKSVKAQIQSLALICSELQVKIDHVKPHGALYNVAAKDLAIAGAVIEAIKSPDPFVLYAPWKSAMATCAAKNGMQVKWEAFADRTYTRDRTLLSRDQPNAVISAPAKAVQQVLSIFHHHQVQSADGAMVELHADTFCIHGDNPAAAILVKKLYDAKLKNDI